MAPSILLIADVLYCYSNRIRTLSIRTNFAMPRATPFPVLPARPFCLPSPTYLEGKDLARHDPETFDKKLFRLIFEPWSML